MRRYIKDTAGNMRLGKIAALTPQKRQCKFGSYYPARTFVKPPPRKAAGTLGVSSGQRGGKWLRNQDVSRKRPDTKYKLNKFFNKLNFLFL